MINNEVVKNLKYKHVIREKKKPKNIIDK